MENVKRIDHNLGPLFWIKLNMLNIPLQTLAFAAKYNYRL